MHQSMQTMLAPMRDTVTKLVGSVRERANACTNQNIMAKDITLPDPAQTILAHKPTLLYVVTRICDCVEEVGQYLFHEAKP